MKPEPDTPELAAITLTMKGLLAVSHDEMKEKMAEYNARKKRRKIKRRVSRAANGRSARH